MNPKVTFKISTGGRWINASAEGTVTDEQVRGILAAAGHPELAQEGTGRAWRITRPGWHVFTYQGAIRVDWWSEHTLGNDYAARQGDRDGLASLRATLEAAGLTVTAPDESVLELAPQPGPRPWTEGRPVLRLLTWISLGWHRRGGWHARVGTSEVWAYPVPWGALWGAWRLHQHDTRKRYLSEPAFGLRLRGRR